MAHLGKLLGLALVVGAGAYGINKLRKAAPAPSPAPSPSPAPAPYVAPQGPGVLPPGVTMQGTTMVAQAASSGGDQGVNVIPADAALAAL